MGPVAVDTNVLAYAEGVERVAADGAKVAQSRRLMRALLDARVPLVIAVQALAELMHVLVIRRRLPPSEASAVVRGWIARSQTVESSQAVFGAALELASDHGLPIFDAIIMAAAVEGRCDLLLSEDFQAGFAWRGIVVVNPFAPNSDPRLARLISA